MKGTNLAIDLKTLEMAASDERKLGKIEQHEERQMINAAVLINRVNPRMPISDAVFVWLKNNPSVWQKVFGTTTPQELAEILGPSSMFSRSMSTT